MKRYILLALLLAGCAATNPIPEPRTQEELDLWIQAQGFINQSDTKSETLWMYSTGSFAMFSLGLAVAAFWASRRLSGLALMGGGVVGMASVWVFDSDWFPWVAGVTVGLVLLSALAFAWVNAYRAYVSQPKPPEEDS